LKKILFFSNSPDKLIEIKSLFKNFSTKVYSPKDFWISHEPKELGKSFAENAKIKSSYGYKSTKIPCFADDSGISIEALNWKPNIYSKRFIESFKNRNECFKYIINKIKQSGKFKAHFKTSVCLTLSNASHIIFEGKINGTISIRPKGKNGFGYDPIFIPINAKKTFAEINKKEKNRLSHRSIAINKLINFLFN